MNQTSRLTDQRNVWKKRALMNLLAGLRAMEAMGHTSELRKVPECLAELQRQRLTIEQLELEVEKALTAKSMAPEGAHAKVSKPARVQAPGPVSGKGGSSPKASKKLQRKQVRAERKLMPSAEAAPQPG